MCCEELNFATAMALSKGELQQCFADWATDRLPGIMRVTDRTAGKPRSPVDEGISMIVPWWVTIMRSLFIFSAYPTLNIEELDAARLDKAIRDVRKRYMISKRNI